MESLGQFEPLRPVLAQFLAEPVEHIEPLGQGHIHETYLVRAGSEVAQSARFVLQRINTHVFSNLDAVMQNIVRVTGHARSRLERQGATDIDRRVLTLCCTHSGRTHHTDPLLGTFRMFVYIPGSLTIRHPGTAADVFEAGRACGEFARLMDDLPAAVLHTTLPDFHATDRRFEALQAAVAEDPMGRASQAAAEWQQLAERQPLAQECAIWARDPQLRLRITHNDTKLDNILFDAATRRALCLLDLDTVMPGYLAYDFGDLVRTCLCTADEDVRDRGAVDLRFEWFEPLLRGYMGELSTALTPLERLSLARGPVWIVLELAMRFLTDHLRGDPYFKISRPDHNLDRARVQLALMDKLLACEAELREAVEAL